MWDLVDIYTKQTICDTQQVEESVDFYCLGGGVLFTPISELIFGKNGFSVIWRLLKSKSSVWLELLEAGLDWRQLVRIVL